MAKTFSASDAALSVLELAKRAPQFTLKYCILYMVGTALSFVLIAATGIGNAFAQLQAAAQRTGDVSPEAVQAAFEGRTGSFLFLMSVSMLFGIVMATMALRKTVLNRESGRFGLQFGRDEVNYALTMMILMLVFVLGTFVAGALAAVMSGFSQALGVVIMAALGVGFLVAAVRLSLFGVVTIGTGQVNLRDAVDLTRGHFWKLFGAYVLWMVLGSILLALAQLVASLGAMAMGTHGTGSMPTSLESLMSVGWMFYILVYGLAAGFMNLGMYCIGAYTWHQIREDAAH